MAIRFSTALTELGTDACSQEHGLYVAQCASGMIAIGCTTPVGRQCLEPLIAGSTCSRFNNWGNKTAVIMSPACHTLMRTAGFISLMMNSCNSLFPLCTAFKTAFVSDDLQWAGLNDSIAALDRGDGASAAHLCMETGRNPALCSMVDAVVEFCGAETTATCDYWHERCAMNSLCAPCLAGLGNGNSLSATVAEYSTPACARLPGYNVMSPAIAGQNAAAVQATLILSAMSYSCAGTSPCRMAVENCFAGFGQTCGVCINGTALPQDAAVCSAIASNYPQGFGQWCQPCSRSVYTVNHVTIATAVVGGMSVSVFLLGHRHSYCDQT